MPCYLWIFAGAPFIDRMRGNRALSATLGAITAPVVGVILNLALCFAIHTLFGEVRKVAIIGGGFDVPVLESLNIAALVLAICSAIAVLRFKGGLIPVVGICAALSTASVLAAEEHTG